MIIHTSVPASVVWDAARRAGVQMDCEQRGSRTHDRAFNVRLEGSSRRRNASNTGQAATWDEWGVFLVSIFDRDPDARCGSAKHPTYANGLDFHIRTDGRFASDFVPCDHNWTFSGEPMISVCSHCGTRWDR